MDPNAQLREHLTDDELAALHDRLDANASRLAGPTAAGATALAGVGTAAADPSPTDDDPDVGLPSARTDLWADGVDATSVVNRGPFNDGTDTVTRTATQDEVFSVGPGEFEGPNVTVIEVEANGHDVTTAVEFPSGLPHDGKALRAYFDASDDASNVTLQLGVAPGILWDGPGTIESTVAEPSAVLITARTYDGGTTWYGAFQFDDDWQAP